jgi:fatty acid-binding protein DegV
VPRMLRELEARVPKGARARFGIIHVGAEALAKSVDEQIRQRYPDSETIIAPATPVLATHLGPGAWGIAFQIEGNGDGEARKAVKTD